jgi:aminoglycoside phosphotransferase (APT) family kinase protein
LSGVVRVGDTVRRPTGPWTPTIHAYLRHLRSAGFTAAPQVLGVDERGREILSYIAGETWGDTIDPDEPKTDLVTIHAWPTATRSDQALAAIGRMLAALHRAAHDFRPAAPRWREYEFPMRTDEVVCHADTGPWNLVYRDGVPVAFIDWDGAQPARPLDDLASAAWHSVPLGPDAFLRECGFTAPFDTGRRLRLFCDSYGLSDPTQILPAISLVKQLGPMKLRYWQPIQPGVAAQHLRAAVRDLEWLEEHDAVLRSALI